ncbi:DciA family protein [Streptomyces sp. NPDC054847]
MSEPTTAGADLARMALQAARRTAKAKPATGRPTRAKRTRGARGDGRDPMPLGAALTRLMDEHGWDTAVTGGNILDQWSELCPELAGKVQPVAYDPKRGILELRPGSHAHATQLRWLERQLCQRINTKLGQTAVRSLRVLAVAAIVDQPTPPAVEPAPDTAPAAPVRTPETASPGYQRARAVALEHKPDRTNLLAPAARAAIERQNQALRARREPETAFTEAAAQADILCAQDDRQPAAGTLEASIRAALAYKHTGGTREPRLLFEAS